MSEKQKFTLQKYTINRELETVHYSELPFESLDEVKRYLRNHHIVMINHIMWADPWQKTVDGDRRHIFKALDFDYWGHMCAFGITPEERTALQAAGWEV